MTDLDNFDKTTDLFLDDLEKIFGHNDSKISQYRSLLSGARMFGIHVSYFFNAIDPYKIILFKKDPIFFTDTSDPNNIANILGISGHWNELSSENKEIVWDYFHSLYLYAYLANGHNKDRFQEHITV